MDVQAALIAEQATIFPLKNMVMWLCFDPLDTLYQNTLPCLFRAIISTYKALVGVVIIACCIWYMQSGFKIILADQQNTYYLLL